MIKRELFYKKYCYERTCVCPGCNNKFYVAKNFKKGRRLFYELRQINSKTCSKKCSRLYASYLNSYAYKNRNS